MNLGLGWVFVSALLFSLILALVLVTRLRTRSRRTGDFSLERDARLGGSVGPERVRSSPMASSPAIIVGRPPRARYPLVFAHGFVGFDAIGPTQLRGEYFRGVRGRLEALGHQVYLTRVPNAAGVKRRASELADQILRLPFDRVNVIAHSMGGVDARYAISKLGLDARVASLTTIGTPHRGTPIADVAARIGEWQRVRKMLDNIGANVDGLFDLTTARMEEFNLLVNDARDVRYASIVGALGTDISKVSTLLAPGYAYLRRRVGPNDGIVPASSQRWGEVLFEIEADHWAQIGWSGAFDAARCYVAIAEYLAERGL